MSHTISVTSDTIDTVLADLPRIVRLALSFGARLRRGTLDVTLPDGRVIRLGGQEPGPNAAMRLHNYGFASRLINGGDIGIAEAYLAGDWDTPDLTQFLYLFCVNHDLIQAMLNDKPLMRFVQLLQHWFNRNTRRQARRNIHAHYDIGNAFYSAWLDPGMTYSSALFEESTSDLTAAQTNKYRRLAEALDLKPDQTLLEIGCGWGASPSSPQRPSARAWWASRSRPSSAILRRSAFTRRALPTRSRSVFRTIATNATATTASPRSR